MRGQANTAGRAGETSHKRTFVEIKSRLRRLLAHFTQEAGHFKLHQVGHLKDVELGSAQISQRRKTALKCSNFLVARG